ncbi:MAG: alpha/beta hydrolase [Bacteroidota bacterium]
MEIASALSKNNVTIVNDNPALPTIVFGHGFGTDQSTWRYISHAFSDYRLVLYDNVGAGKSDPVAYNNIRYSSLKGYTFDLLDICRELNLKDAIFVGHSVSGMVGLLAAIAQPERFSKMVFVGASPRYLNDVGYIGGFDQEDLEGLFGAMNANYYAWASGFAPLAMRNDDRPSLAEEFASTLSSIRPDIGQAVARAIFQSDHRSELADFDKPSLIIQAQNDIAVPAEVGEFLHKNIKNSTLVVVNANGHFPQMSAPEEIISAIRKFIA